MRTQFHIPVPMRDGTLLSTELRLPPGQNPGPFPTVLWRTPYSNSDPTVHGLLRHVHAGYALVTQDCRGRFDSDGVFNAFHEADDGFDTIAWITSQPWSNGSVGMVGASYSTTTQLTAAWTRPPGLKAFVPRVMSRDLFKDTFYVNGVFALSLAADWSFLMQGRTQQNTAQLDWTSLYHHLPLNTLPKAAGFHDTLYVDLLSHPTYDDYYRPTSVEAHWSDIHTPALHIAGWYDIYLQGTLRTYQALTALGKAPQKLIIGPWIHAFNLSASKVGQLDFGPDAALNIEQIESRWLDRFLKNTDNKIDQEPPVSLFVMGINQWRSEPAWPIARAIETPFYLTSQGHANTLFGNGGLTTTPPSTTSGAPTDHYTYSPHNPVPNVAGPLRGSLAGPGDHTPIERRDDVLVYTSPTIEKPTEVTGYIHLILHISSNVTDTDFVARLCDVYPDGRSIILCDGVAATRFREGLHQALPMTPGEIYEINICLTATSNVFLPGHKIRLEVTSSCFPRFARNLNTGEPYATGTNIKIAHQTIHHTPTHPSRLILPIVP
jgi:uncharacterized protein